MYNNNILQYGERISSRPALKGRSEGLQMVNPRERNPIKSRPKRLAVSNYNINFIVILTRILHFSRIAEPREFRVTIYAEN